MKPDFDFLFISELLNTQISTATCRIFVESIRYSWTQIIIYNINVCVKLSQMPFDDRGRGLHGHNNHAFILPLFFLLCCIFNCLCLWGPDGVEACVSSC